MRAQILSSFAPSQVRADSFAKIIVGSHPSNAAFSDINSSCLQDGNPITHLYPRSGTELMIRNPRSRF